MSSDYRSTTSLKASSKQPVSRDYDSHLDSQKRSMALHDLHMKEKSNASEVKQRLDQINEHAYIHEHLNNDQTSRNTDNNKKSTDKNHFMFYGYDITLMLQRLMSLMSIIPMMLTKLRVVISDLYQGKRSFGQLIEPYRLSMRNRIYAWSSFFVESCILPFDFLKRWFIPISERFIDVRAMGSWRKPLNKKSGKFSWSQLRTDSYWTSFYNIYQLGIGLLCFCVLGITGLFRNYVLPFLRSDTFKKAMSYCRAIIVAVSVFVYELCREIFNKIMNYNKESGVREEDMSSSRSNNAQQRKNVNRRFDPGLQNSQPVISSRT